MSDRKRTDEDAFVDLDDYPEVPRVDIADLGQLSGSADSVVRASSETGLGERGDPKGAQGPRVLRWQLTGDLSPWDLEFRIRRRREEPAAPSGDGRL